jgi:hypothetical protein
MEHFEFLVINYEAREKLNRRHPYGRSNGRIISARRIQIFKYYIMNGQYDSIMDPIIVAP